MHSPALALGWELWAKHRQGLSVIGIWAVVAAVLVRVLPRELATTFVADPTMVLSCFVFLYLMWICVFAESTLASNDAGFPPRLFTMPVRTSLLVAWPMLYGMAAVALVWLWLEWLIVYPRGARIPGWPALVLAAGMAAIQAICWTLVRLPLLRIAIAGLGFPLVFLTDLFFRVQRRVEIAPDHVALKSLSIIAVAYLVAWIGVAYDRRGVRVSLSGLWLPVIRTGARLLGRRRAFTSAGGAQCWLEVRRHASLVPMLVAVFAVMLFWTVVSIVGLPPLFALFLGIGMGNTSFWASDLRLSPFFATRPVSSDALARAKLDAAGLCALGTWVCLMLLIPLLVVASTKVEHVQKVCAELFPTQSGWLLGFFASIALAGLVGLTWLHFVAGTCLSISGRDWLLNWAALFHVVSAGALTSMLVYNSLPKPGMGHEALTGLIAILWSLGGLLMLLKFAAVAAALRLPWHSRTAPILIVWLALAASLLIPLYVLIPVNLAAHSVVTLYVLLALPLARPLLLPAAIAWNRHR